jgi:hypothetical protein
MIQNILFETCATIFLYSKYNIIIIYMNQSINIEQDIKQYINKPTQLLYNQINNHINDSINQLNQYEIMLQEATNAQIIENLNNQTVEEIIQEINDLESIIEANSGDIKLSIEYYAKICEKIKVVKNIYNNNKVNMNVI